jgi:hypothetical protein
MSVQSRVNLKMTTTTTKTTASSSSSSLSKKKSPELKITNTEDPLAGQSLKKKRISTIAASSPIRESSEVISATASSSSYTEKNTKKNHYRQAWDDIQEDVDATFVELALETKKSNKAKTLLEKETRRQNKIKLKILEESRKNEELELELALTKRDVIQKV